MKPTIKLRQLSVIILLASLVGCASVQPTAYSELSSSAQMAPNPNGTSDRKPYRYTTQFDHQKYKSIIIDPVTIYHGADHQFADMDEVDKIELAQYMQSTFADTLGKRFELVRTPRPDTLRLKLVLTGADTSTPVLSTLLHFDIGGGLYNVVQSVRGREPLLTGSVMYAVELYDASNNQLLNAYLTKQYPRAMNITASFGSLHAARTGIEKGANALLEEIK
ncbi:DUF3313 domain-containing protein [Uliginosibacterium gangwonense]|uniref:DUF3313 domain-containing protein n=1 Tax=Uliginosibacterium gangwonense TaxID=392736 RepID=UPI000369A18A|nr:DUF3313 domain-containing protein [Uliginosibacterium gangwonense]